MMPTRIRKYLPLLLSALSAVIAASAFGFLDNLGLETVIVLIAALAVYSATHVRRSGRAKDRQENRLSAVERYSRNSQASAWFDRTVKPYLPLPPLGGWALDPEAAGYLIRLIEKQKPHRILELGSGISTLLSAYALERNGIGKMVSLEGEMEYAERTQGLLSAHELADRAEVRYAPLSPVKIDDWEGLWYDPSALSDLPEGGIDLLVIDGPPGATGPLARYPAVPLLGRYLTGNCLVLLDDAARQEELWVVEAWSKEGWNSHSLPIGKGIAILTKNT